MARGHSAFDPEAEREEVRGTMSPGGMCLLFVPRDLYVTLSKEATKRGMTLADMLSTSVEHYLAKDQEEPPAPEPDLPEREEFEHANFELVDVRDASEASRGVKLKGWD